MTSISVRVPDDLKKKMKKLNHINWSDELREAILKIANELLGRINSDAEYSNEPEVYTELVNTSNNILEESQYWQNRAKQGVGIMEKKKL